MRTSLLLMDLKSITSISILHLSTAKVTSNFTSFNFLDFWINAFLIKVPLLNRSLYGLKQAPRFKYLLLSIVNLDLGFCPFESDRCIYRNDKGVIIGY